MDLIEWNNNLKLGVNIIDGHHEQLVCLINESYNAIQLNNRYMLNRVLNDIIHYTNYHLVTEESLMNKYNYSPIADHEKAHTTFYNKIIELQSKINADEALYKIPLVSFLKDWLMGHILISDRDLAGFLISKGVA